MSRNDGRDAPAEGTSAGRAHVDKGGATRRRHPAQAARGGGRGDRIAGDRRRADRWPGIRAAGPALTSAAVHVAVLVALAMLFVAAEPPPERVVIVAGAAEEQAVDDVVPVEFEAEAAPDAPDEAEHIAAVLPPADMAAALPEPLVIEGVAAADDAPVEPAGLLPADLAAADMLAAIGGGAAAGAGGRRGGGPAAGGAGAPTFFGKAGKGGSVCFICDNSISYRDGGFHFVLEEVMRAVEALPPGNSFFVIFYSDSAYPMHHPQKADALEPATPQAKQRLREWLGTVEMCYGGAQGLREAVRIAKRLRADVVYFLSDGENFETQKQIMLAADFGNAAVHTFGMQQTLSSRRTGLVDPRKVARQQECNQHLVDIAAAHRGEFTPVHVPPQAAALEQARPIRRNVTRGEVWGLRLPAAAAD